MLVKYPRTPHLTWSEGISSDDKVIKSLSRFFDKEVVVTVKLDGENSTLYKTHIHARSVNSGNHISRDWLKNFWVGFRNDIPENFRICGENMYAKHSIFYEDLKTYFYGFSVWEGLTCLSWEETLDWFNLLGIISVPILYHGVFSEAKIKSLWDGIKDRHEGYVVRLDDEFSYSDFSNCVGKFVRANHVNHDAKHWMYGQNVIKNKLKTENCL